jgi:hypothetical protein
VTIFHHLAKCGWLVVVWVFMSGVMHANSIDYSFAGIGSGTLNGISFTNDAFAVSIHANTSNVAFQSNLGQFGIENLSGTITLSGMGTASFTASLFVFGGNGFDVIGFGNFSQGNLIADINTGKGFASYNLASNFGPIAISNSNPSQFCGVATSLGALCYKTMSNLTFQSTVAVSAVPESSSMLQVGTGLIGLAAVLRRRKLLG